MGQLIALILEAEGHECLVTDDSYEAWALLHTLPFDVLTQDTMRPDIDGVEFYYLVRGDPSLASLAVVIVTAVPRGPRLDPDLDAYLTKPFRRRELAAAVAEALRKRGKPLPEPPGKGPAFTPASLLKRLRGECDDVREVAPVDRLNDARREERLREAWALGRRGDDLAVERLMSALEDPDPAVRRVTAMALGRIGREDAVQALTTLLDDQDDLTRMVAARALGKAGGSGVEAALVERLEDGSEWVRRAAMQALGEIKAPEAVPALARILHGAAASLRQAAGRALGHIGTPSAGALVAALEDRDPAVRRAAILGLSRIEVDDRVDRALIGALGDEDAGVREAAASALGDRDPRRVVAPLVAALDDRSPDVAATAATALAWAGAVQALPELERVAREDARQTIRGEPVAEAARTAIRWIKSNR